MPFDGIQKLQAVHLLHRDIRQNQMGFPFVHLLQGFMAAGRGSNRNTQRLHEHPKAHEHIRLVVHDEYPQFLRKLGQEYVGAITHGGLPIRR